MAHSRNPKNTEVDAYAYIRNELEKLGWNIKNPARVIDGEVYKQNEALSNIEIKKMINRDMPEAIVKINEEEFWVIESKRDKKDINKALDDAKNQYAKKINLSKKIKCVIITGIAGNDIDGYTVINQYLKKSTWQTIIFNGKPKDTLLSRDQVSYILNNQTPNWLEFPDFPEEKYLSSAEKINEILHDAGINKNKRARFIAGLILSLSISQEINLNIQDTTTLVKNINTLIEQKLNEVNKQNFFNYIKLEVPPSRENHIKYRTAIIDTLKELQTLDIKNAMSSGTDILGKLYEKFLKYGNGAKEIGIVLTPRHITEFAVSVLNIKYNDYVLDPTCGTGGFLVSAFDYVKKTSTDNQIEKFKNYNLFGVEQDDEVVALALVNMIFRGDGRNNMSEGNCFQKNIVQTIIDEYQTGKYEKRTDNKNLKPIITKVLMNPPFALKKGDEKEYKFIDYALSQMEDGGILFAILPSPIMFKGKQVKQWRQELLKHNTLKAVVKLPEDLFYPVGVHTSCVIIQKGIAHNFANNVYWGQIIDGYIKKKGVMLKRGGGNIDVVASSLRDFLFGVNIDKKNIPRIYAIEPILNDSDLECAPEYYLKERDHEISEISHQMTLSYMRLVEFLINNPHFSKLNLNTENDIEIDRTKKLDDLFTIQNAKSKNIEQYGDGEIPFVTSTSNNNGVEKFIDEDDEKLIYKKPCITLSSFGFAAVQITPFVARSHGAVLVLIPKIEMSVKQLFYYTAQINLHGWRFSYGRWVTQKRLLKLEIKNPINPNLPPLSVVKSKLEKSLRIIKNSGL